jgi:thioredoxin 1
MTARLRTFIKPGALILPFALLAAGAVSARPVSARAPAQPQASHAASGSTTAKIKSEFAPFDAWKSALRAGDQAALARHYSSDPAATVRVGTQSLNDPAEEPRYWAGLIGSGYTDLNPKLLEVEKPKPELTSLLLRVEALAPKGSLPQASAGPLRVVCSVEMVWLQEGNEWRIVGTQRGNFVPNATRTLPQPASTNPNLYPEPAEGAGELQTALGKAAKSHKRVLVVFGANWCYDCHVLDTTFHSKECAPLVNSNFDVVHINIGEEGKDNHDIADRLGVNLARGIPSLAVLDADGKVLVAQKNGEFESSVKIGPADVRAFLEEWKPQHGSAAASKPSR